MKQEDYISGKIQNFDSYVSPISQKHLYGILSIIVIASLAAMFTPNVKETNDATFDKNVHVSSNNTLEEIIDPRVSLTEILTGDTNTKNNTKNTELENLDNYDDQLTESLLVDSDNEIDKRIRNLAQEVDKSLSTQSKWFAEDVQKGDTISSIFSDLNIPYSTMIAIADHKEVKEDIANLKPGQQLSFLLDDNNLLIAFVTQINKTEQIRFVRKDLNKNEFSFVIEKLGSHLTDQKSKESQIAHINKANEDSLANSQDQKEEIPLYKKRGRLVVVNIDKGQAFSTAALASGLTYTEIDQISRLFKGRVQFSKHIQPGDQMRVLFSEAKGEGKIDAIEFKLARLGVISTYRHLDDDKYYDEKGSQSSVTAFLRFPVNGNVRISSHFNPNRRHPVTGQVRPHNGTDFAVRIGTPVIAPADGIVDKATYSHSAGYYIVIRHKGSYSTVYMHLSKLGVKAGQKVKLGEIIARSGNTGLSTGPHLHYELRLNGRPVNSMRVKLPTKEDVTVAQKQRQKFINNVNAFKKDLHNDKLISKLN